MSSYDPDEPPKKRRPVPPLTESYLREEARRYLERWWPSEKRMRDVLMRRVKKCVEAGTGSWKDGYAYVDTIIKELVEQGTLDDKRYAAAWAGQLHDRGRAGRSIAWKIREKGVPAEIAQDAVKEMDASLDEQGIRDPDLVRAIAYVRRRRLGPMRNDPAERASRREKDLAAVARAGFGFGIALRVIDAEDLDLLEEEAGLR